MILILKLFKKDFKWIFKKKFGSRYIYQNELKYELKHSYFFRPCKSTILIIHKYLFIKGENI